MLLSLLLLLLRLPHLLMRVRPWRPWGRTRRRWGSPRPGRCAGQPGGQTRGWTRRAQHRGRHLLQLRLLLQLLRLLLSLPLPPRMPLLPQVSHNAVWQLSPSSFQSPFSCRCGGSGLVLSAHCLYLPQRARRVDNKHPKAGQLLISRDCITCIACYPVQSRLDCNLFSSLGLFLSKNKKSGLKCHSTGAALVQESVFFAPARAELPTNTPLGGSSQSYRDGVARIARWGSRGAQGS
mmetsp:Transcript_28965/g.71534  ORF Transcript_28965/g.71534 Transcript_28965/m.71534 type:complete len:236 (+) Transcript_28965:216-923(+)